MRGARRRRASSLSIIDWSAGLRNLYASLGAAQHRQTGAQRMTGACGSEWHVGAPRRQARSELRLARIKEARRLRWRMRAVGNRNGTRNSRAPCICRIGHSWPRNGNPRHIGHAHTRYGRFNFQATGPGPRAEARSEGLERRHLSSDRHPQPMHSVRPLRKRSSSAIFASMCRCQAAESFAHSVRVGTPWRGSLRSSAATSSSDRPIFCAKTMKATRRNTARG
jgi:hypothetical protein